MDEQKVETVDGMVIHYRQYGHGSSVLLLLHGAVGSYNDFSYQMEQKNGNYGLNEHEFTLIAPDLPGYGRSELISDTLKPCEPTLEYFELCARVSAKLMAQLNYKTYSVAGWNDGARIAALLAINCQSRVNSLILWGFSAMMDKQACWAVSKARDTSQWEPSVLKSYTDVYGEQGFSDSWRHYVDFVIRSLDLEEHFDIRERLYQIKCPTLVLHGSLDPLVDFERHVRPVGEQIYDSHVHRFPGLAHNIHQADPENFNQVMGKFVLNVPVI